MFRRCVVGKMRGEGPTNIPLHTIVGQVNAAIVANIISMIITTAIGAPVEAARRKRGIIAMVMAITAVVNINAHTHRAGSNQNALLVDT